MRPISPANRNEVLEALRVLFPAPSERSSLVEGVVRDAFDELKSITVLPPYVSAPVSAIARLLGKRQEQRITRDLIEYGLRTCLTSGGPWRTRFDLFEGFSGADWKNFPYSRLIQIVEIIRARLRNDLTLLHELENLGLSRWREMCLQNLDALFEEAASEEYSCFTQACIGLISAKTLEQALQWVEAGCDYFMVGSLDSNFMQLVGKSPEVLDDCKSSTEAWRIYGEDGYNRAEKILRISHFTNEIHRGFWLPYRKDASFQLPGAVRAAQTRAACVVHCADQMEFGAAWGDDVRRRLQDYLDEKHAQKHFRTFISMPLLKAGEPIGVVNINSSEDELSLYDGNAFSLLIDAVNDLVDYLPLLL